MVTLEALCTNILNIDASIISFESLVRSGGLLVMGPFFILHENYYTKLLRATGSSFMAVYINMTNRASFPLTSVPLLPYASVISTIRILLVYSSGGTGRMCVG